MLGIGLEQKLINVPLPEMAWSGQRTADAMGVHALSGAAAALQIRSRANPGMQTPCLVASSAFGSAGCAVQGWPACNK